MVQNIEMFCFAPPHPNPLPQEERGFPDGHSSNILSHELYKSNTVFQDEKNCIFLSPRGDAQVPGFYIKDVDFMGGVGEYGYRGLSHYSQFIPHEIRLIR